MLVPGIQGRWEWMEPAVRAVSKRCRVLAISFPGEPGSGMSFDGEESFDVFGRQIDRLLDERGLASAAICGVSFGGLVALHYAASRPARVRALALVSAPGPRWRPNPAQARFVDSPRSITPIFVLKARGRLYPEVRAALPTFRARLQFLAGHGVRVVRAPFSASRMSSRVILSRAVDFAAAARKVTAPTLIVTGEPHLDQVVPVEGTREYAGLIAGAQSATLADTGHIGLVTRPKEFAELVGGFVSEHAGVI